MPMTHGSRASVRDHGREPAVPIATSSLAERRATLPVLDGRRGAL